MPDRRISLYPADDQACGRIDIGRGLSTLVDADDLDRLSQFRWRALVRPVSTYVRAWIGGKGIYLHRFLLGATKGQVVDHVNRNTLDNRRENLRIATSSQNGANRVPDNRANGTTSKFKGVCRQAGRRHWYAFIHVEGKSHWLGSFDSEEEAAEAYDAAAITTWGEYARTNF